MNVLGIYREEKYSNRAVNADRAIMDSVLKTLKDKVGTTVAIVVARGEDINLDTFDIEIDFDLVFSMAQEEKVLKVLDHFERKGAVVVNSAKAIRNCFRSKLSELLNDEDFSYPRYTTLKVAHDTHNVFDSENGYWVKRGDFHAVVDEDVVHISSVNELASALTQFKSRGVEEVILQENCAGELFKFYGVRDSFFNLRYMGKTSRNRYEFDPGNSNINFDQNRLEILVHKAAKILELDFFGGDCIITSSGGMHFIDFNDWPSFRTCVHDVSPTMVSYALNKLNRGLLNDNCINQ